MIEGKIEQINLSLYPISEDAIISSRTTTMEIRCNTAADALHVYVADKSDCHHFITADINLANILKRSNLAKKLIPINMNDTSDIFKLFSDFA
jgi:predicted nucleic acid-binding protein